MPGVEIQILNLKLPQVPDLSKVKCAFSLGSVSYSTIYPFKPLTFQALDNYSVISVTISSNEKILGGVDIPASLILNKKASTFRLSDSFTTPDKRKSPVKGKDPAEITLSVKQLASWSESKGISNNIEKKLEETVEQLDISYKSRRELQLSIEETTQQLSEMIKTQDSIINKYLEEKTGLSERIKDLEEAFNQEKCKNLTLAGKNNELEMGLETFKTSEKHFKSIEKWCNEVNGQTEHYMTQQNQLIEKMKAANGEFQVRCDDYQSKVESLINDKISLMKVVESLQKENFAYKRENDQLTAELLKLRARLSGIEGEAVHFSSIKSKESELNDKLRATESLLSSLKEELSRSSISFKDSLNKAISGKSQLAVENKELSSRILTLERIINNKDTEQEKLAQENKRLCTEMACIEQHLCIKEDSNQIMDDLLKNNQELREENNENKSAVLEQNERIQENEKKVEELEGQLKEKTEENEVLMSAVMKLQRNRDVYVPVNGDPIDTALADYINTMDDPLPVPFTREDEGIYLFGTKRIFVKLEQGRIIIRVGGGFMQVHEFIDVYTNTEVEKFARERADQASRLRLSIMGKLNESSPNKYSQCFGVQRRNSSVTRTTISPNHSTAYNY